MTAARRLTGFLPGVGLAATFVAAQAFAAERELDENPAPSSAAEIETPIERVFPLERSRLPLIPWVREQLEDLPAFFADTVFEARYRTYYLRNDRAIDAINEAWAMGGSVYYRSGWLFDLLQAEVEGFTSQPIVAPDSRPGTFLLEPVQDGYSVLGIANGKLRYGGLTLTGGRQYLDLPYANRRDNRMIPNTFESLVLAKQDGEITFSTGYSWKVKLRNSDEFKSFTKAIGLGKNRGLAHGGALWQPSGDFRMGVIGGAIPDLLANVYSEASFAHDLSENVEGRLDTQFTYRWDIGDDLRGDLLDETWNFGIRGSGSYKNLVLRLGFSVTASDAAIISVFGTNPSYVDLMSRTFTRADEKALLASASYDFSKLGLDGLTFIVNFVAAFEGKILDERRDAQELDMTLDYRIKSGWLDSFWLRVRGSWIHERNAPQDGKELRVIFRYDFPVI